MTALAVTLTVEELRALVRAAVREELSANAPPGADVMTAEEAGKVLRLHPAVVRRYVRTQGLPAHRVGSEYRFRRSEILAWLEEHATRPGVQATRHGGTLKALKGGA